jgi:hypothetical protein
MITSRLNRFLPEENFLKVGNKNKLLENHQPNSIVCVPVKIGRKVS